MSAELDHAKKSFWFSDSEKFVQATLSGTTTWAKIVSGNLAGKTVCYTKSTPVGEKPKSTTFDYYYLGDGYFSHNE